MGVLRKFFTKENERLILSAIKEAESHTSGEIRVRVEKKAGRHPMRTARKAFVRLGMRKTKLRNGVLFFLGVNQRRFVVLGDDGINNNVPEGFWGSVRDVVQEHFQKGLFSEGLAEGIRRAGQQLATFFPCERGDMDELANAISYAREGRGK
ncbi:MAG: TPM domain-containing protein [bacterium]|nr:TPM domain-containing protein [bacterium]